MKLIQAPKHDWKNARDEYDAERFVVANFLHFMAGRGFIVAAVDDGGDQDEVMAAPVGADEDRFSDAVQYGVDAAEDGDRCAPELSARTIEAFEAIYAVDVSRAFFVPVGLPDPIAAVPSRGRHWGRYWVRFVCGNAPYEVMADYTCPRRNVIDAAWKIALSDFEYVIEDVAEAFAKGAIETPEYD